MFQFTLTYNKKRLKVKALAILFMTSIAPSSQAITTPQIIASAISPSCIEYRISGICYWLLCSAFGCTVKTSVRVTHYVPNAVVSSYSQPGDNPWSEVSLVGTGIPGIAEGGGNNEQKVDGQQKYNLRFKNVDVIGHPAIGSPQFSSVMGSFGYTCPGASTPLVPYYVSTIDGISWRGAIPESLYPEAMIPGMREIGSTLSGNMWGNIYPRSGLTTETHDFVAGALTAQRAADIVTNVGQPHVYQPMTQIPSPGYWPPSPVLENTNNHKWQALYPQMSSTCSIFPTASTPVDEKGAYAWTLWQPYSCCKRMGQTLLTVVTF